VNALSAEPQPAQTRRARDEMAWPPAGRTLAAAAGWLVDVGSCAGRAVQRASRFAAISWPVAARAQYDRA
jgi:hypothetical protein